MNYPKQFRIVTNGKTFAIQRKDKFFWNWEGGTSSVAENFGNYDWPKETFETKSLAESYIKRIYGDNGMLLIKQKDWEEV